MDGHDAWADVQTASTSRFVNNGPLSAAASVSIEAQRPSLYRLTSETRRSVEGLNGCGTGSKGKQRAMDVRRSLDELSRSSAADRPEDLLGRLAIIHELSKTDTLAGISLQYGISVASLRQANRLMMVNDRNALAIRKTLHIPLDACTQPPTREIIERIEMDDDHLHIYSRPLPKPRSTLPTPRSVASSPAGSRSHSLDLVRSEEVILSRPRSPALEALSEYMPSTSFDYSAALIDLATPSVSDPPSPGADEAPLTKRTHMLTRMPLAPVGEAAPLIPGLAALQIDPSIRVVRPKFSPPPIYHTHQRRSSSATIRAPPSPVAMATSKSGAGWEAADDSELRMAADWLKSRRTVSAAGGRRIARALDKGERPSPATISAPSAHVRRRAANHVEFD